MRIPFDNSYARLPSDFYQRVDPAKVGSPRLVKLNSDLADDLRLDADSLESSKGVAFLSGQCLLEGSEPLAMAYCGHQFGHFNPQLGDGRAILLGELIDSEGARRDIHLKGSGRTPFSRGGDGLSALGPAIREYLVSEAMHALGVPTTRALAVLESGDQVYRDSIQPGGIFARVAYSHMRIGTFQWFASKGDRQNLKVLADYAIARLYPRCLDSDNPYLAFLEAIVGRQADLIAHWMSIGFIHGVMNTDNMNISGETIDYGPCAFMDAYYPQQKFSSIDHHGRYAYGNQASIGQWNLARLAECLLPLLNPDQAKAVELAQVILEGFTARYQRELRRRFNAKIGIDNDSEGDWKLVQSLLTRMAEGRADFTLVFRRLSTVLECDQATGSVTELFECEKGVKEWLDLWRRRIAELEPASPESLMRSVNPIYIPRNHRVEQVIQAAVQGDYEPFLELNTVLAKPFFEQIGFEAYERPPDSSEIVSETFCGT